MPDHFIDDEAQEFLRKFGIEIGVAGKLSQTGYLFLFPTGIRRWEIILRLILANGLGYLESLGQHEHQCCIDIVDAFAKLLQLFVHVSSPDCRPPRI